ncbi:Adenylate cyclase type 10 [Phlyctochytrium planicorne]|nr:Adenylate cyclase type 10 [Phlyctochytrium planicorne]
MASQDSGVPAIIASLVPQAVQQSCVADPERYYGSDSSTTLRIPGHLETVGACIILDLSGYTHLTELLFEGSGDVGGERLFKTINPFFGAIIDTVHSFGGDIIKFCGDSLIIVWSQHTTGRTASSLSIEFVQNVIFCITEILSNFDGYLVELPISNQEFNSVTVSRGVSNNYELGVHVGIGFGQIHHLFVGEKKKGRCEYLIVGEAIIEASSMLEKVWSIIVSTLTIETSSNQTKRGQIAMSSASWDAFCQSKDLSLGQWDSESKKNHVIVSKGSALHQTVFSKRAPPKPPRVMIPGISILRKVEDFIDEAAVTRLSALTTRSVNDELIHSRLSEFRQLTTVFLQIQGFDRISNTVKALVLIQKLFDIVKRPLADYKGRLRQIVYDDKGLTFLLVWGLPPSNAMDHVLGLFCAIAIRDELTSAALAEFAIGVSCGTAFTGTIGNSVRSDFNIFGRAINLAARCMTLALAKNSIVCQIDSIQTKVIETGGFEFSKVASVALKGVLKPMDVAVLSFGTKDPLRAGMGRLSTMENGNSDGGSTVGRDDAMEKSLPEEIVGRNKEVAALEEKIAQWLDDKETMADNSTTATGSKRLSPNPSTGIVLLGKSGCGKTTLGNLCEDLLRNHQADDKTIICKVDCFEIARHTSFYGLKFLLLQLFDYLLKDIEYVRECKNLVDTFLSEESNQKGHFLNPKFRRSSSILSNETGPSRELSFTTLPYVPETITRGLSKINSVRESMLESLATVETDNIRKNLLDIDNSAFGTKANQAPSIEAEFMEILECLGFSKKWTGAATVIEEILYFLGIKSGDNKGLSMNPLSVRTILLRIIALLTNQLQYRLVFMVDNSQWLDPRSLTALTFILKSHIRRFMMIMLSRPMKELKDSVIASDMSEILKMGNVLVISLNTLDQQGTTQMLIKHLGVQPSSSLIEEILRNSGGIPMVIEILAKGLKAPGVIRVTGGVARLADGVSLKADEKDVGSMISSQFDMLSLRFQIILRVASISGINFSVSQTVDVCNSILSEYNSSESSLMTLAEAAHILENEDVYEFLLHPTAGSAMGEAASVPETYSFRHIYIQKGIRSMILTDLRKLIHLKLFLHFDLAVRAEQTILRVIDPKPGPNRYINSSYGVILAEGYRHFEECATLIEQRLGDIPSIHRPDYQVLTIRVDYLMRLAGFYWEKQIYGEALVYLDKLFETWDNVMLCPDADLKRAEFAILTDNLAKARFCSYQSYGLRAYSYLTQSYTSNLRGFEYLGHPFPKTPGESVKYAIRGAGEILRQNKEIRNFLGKIKKSKDIICVSVDYSTKETEDVILDELLTLMAGNGILVAKEMEALVAAIKLVTRTGNVFKDGITLKRAISMMFSDLFRAAICGNHTAASISLLILYFVDHFINLSSIDYDEPFHFVDVDVDQNQSESTKGSRQSLKKKEVERDGDGNAVWSKHPADSRGLIPIQFECLGDMPAIFSMEAGNLTFGAGFVARSRDFFKAQEVFLRLALIVLAEVKGDMSFVGVTSYAYYREIMHFSGNFDFVVTLINRVLFGQIEQRIFRPYLLSDGLLYATESLEMGLATSREKQYWLEIGLPGFDDNVQEAAEDAEKGQEENQQGSSRILFNAVNGSKSSLGSGLDTQQQQQQANEATSQRLPPFLERDSLVPLVLFRIARLGLAFEGVLEDFKSKIGGLMDGHGLGMLVHGVEQNLEKLSGTLGAGLEKAVKAVDELFVKTTNVGPNMRFIIMDQMVTFWRIWSLYGDLRVRWIRRGAVGNGKVDVDVWRSGVSAKLCKKWSKVMMGTVKMSGTYLVPVLKKSFDATVQLARPNYRKAAAFWRDAVRMIVDLSEGRPIKNTKLVGLFCEPIEWRGLEYFGYHLELLKGRSTVLDALALLDELLRLDARRNRGKGKVNPIYPLVPQGLEKVYGEVVMGLEGVLQRLERFGNGTKLEMFLVRSVLGFVLDMKRC